MFGRDRPKPDPALLAQARDTGEVQLGAYPEELLAVTGAYPLSGSLDPRPGQESGASPFRHLDTPARQAAMRAALDRVLAEGTVTLPAGASLEDAVSGGLSGRLPVTGELGQLYRLSAWCRQRGFRSGFLVYLAVPEGVQVPPEAVPPGVETAISVLAGGHEAPVLLVERSDYGAGTRTYALRTVRQEFTWLAGFLFADVSIPEGQCLRADADMQFRFGPRTLKVDNSFVREAGAEEALGKIVVGTKKEEPRYIRVSASDLVNLMTSRFEATEART